MAAGRFLRAVPVPFGWTPFEWDLLAEVVRYHRGAEPAARHKRFARLSTEDRDCVRALAGVLRLARALRRCGVTGSGGLRIDETAAYVRLCVSCLRDTEDSAARLAAAKHLLEGYLRRPIIIQSATGASSVRGLQAPQWAPMPVAGRLRRGDRPRPRRTTRRRRIPGQTLAPVSEHLRAEPL
jgi:hypothetical protein